LSCLSRGKCHKPVKSRKILPKPRFPCYSACQGAQMPAKQRDQTQNPNLMQPADPRLVFTPVGLRALMPITPRPKPWLRDNPASCGAATPEVAHTLWRWRAMSLWSRCAAQGKAHTLGRDHRHVTAYLAGRAEPGVTGAAHPARHSAPPGQALVQS
jgi:hypothetical protein